MISRRSFFGALLVIMIVMCALVFITYRKGYDEGQANVILQESPVIQVSNDGINWADCSSRCEGFSFGRYVYSRRVGPAVQPTR